MIKIPYKHIIETKNKKLIEYCLLYLFSIFFYETKELIYNNHYITFSSFTPLPTKFILDYFDDIYIDDDYISITSYVSEKNRIIFGDRILPFASENPVPFSFPIKNNNSYELIDLDKEVPEGKIYSHYRGQASHNFMKSYYGDKKNRVAEGVDFYTECIGPVEVVIDEYSGSLRSSLTYCGAENLKTFKNNIEFFESTSSYMPESNYRNI